MAEVKTGLEGVLGYVNEHGTLGKVYYNALLGTAGTKNCGVGTNTNNGASRVYWGSGLIFAQGKPTVIAAGSTTIGSSGSETVCYTIQAGTGGVTATAGGTDTSVAAAIAARAGTTDGKCPLAYVTVGTSGSVLSGSIVDERTFALSNTISYVTGVDWSLEENKKDVWNRKTFAHYKDGRSAGKFSVKEQYVSLGSADVWPSSSTYATVPTLAFELAIDDIAGTIGQALLFMQCGKDSESFSMPEEDVDTFEVSATFGSMTNY